MNNKITKKPEEQRFEFILFINNKIICQRYFLIKNFNETALKSIELKELMDSLVGMNNGDFGSMGIIPKALKVKSIDYLWEKYNPYITQNDRSKSKIEKKDIFEFEIRVDKKTVAKSCFSGNVFPQSVRYRVDIKDIIPTIILKIREALSQKKYTYTNQQLVNNLFME